MCTETSREKRGEISPHIINLDLTRKKEGDLLIMFYYSGYKAYVSQKDGNQLDENTAEIILMAF